MEGGITDEARSTVLRAALAQVGRQEMRAALASAAEPARGAPKAAVNALHALRKHRDPTEAVGRAAYRSALPWVATAIADDCLALTIEELGDASEDPTREQLSSALDRVRAQYSDVTMAVMLATVAGADMPASDLCFAILSEDERFGLTHLSDSEDDPDGSDSDGHHPDGHDPDDGDDSDGTATAAGGDTARSDQPTGGTEAVALAQREARRVRRRQEAEAKRKRSEVGRQATEQARRARKQGRSGSPRPSGEGDRRPPAVVTSSAPRLTRRALLTPAEKEEFDTGDPWVAGVVVAWVPFDAGHPDELSELDQPGTPGSDGKERPCVVIAGAPDHLLVRPGYSEGGLISRDWRSTPLRHWRSAGFDRPTWVDHEARRIPREGVHAPQAWLVPDDWNALW